MTRVRTLDTLMASEISPILSQYIPIADLLVKTFGEDCEVVLHDLSKPENSVVYVANGKVTGRRVGDSFQHLISQALIAEKTYKDVIPNYYFRHQDKLIRSSSLFIRDLEGHLVGALCINLDTSKITQQITYLTGLLPDVQKAPSSLNPFRSFTLDSIDPTNVNSNMLDIVNEMIDSILASHDSAFNKESRLKIIRFMLSRGVFQVKGAVEIVAERLGISKATMYGYIDEARNNP